MVRRFGDAQWLLLMTQYLPLVLHKLILRYLILDEKQPRCLQGLHNVDKFDVMTPLELEPLVSLHAQRNYLTQLTNHPFSRFGHFARAL